MSELTTTPEPTPTNFLSQPLLATLVLDWEKAIYAIFIVLALVTRLWGLGDRVMSHDESLHTQYSLQYYNGDGYQHTPLMHGPSLFHLSALSYWLFGPSDFSSRLPVALVGVVLVALPYLLRKWLGQVGAIFTSFLLLVSPFITYYSRYIRHDIYLITFGAIVFMACWFYIGNRQDKYLWWFAGALALMFTTMEASFIYVAIFGSFLVLRLVAQLLQSDWFWSALPTLTRPGTVIILSLLLAGAGFGGLRAAERASEAATETPEASPDGQGFAADPNAAPAGTTSETTNQLLHWLQVIGVVGFAAGLFWVAREIRPELDKLPEFDLIVLFTTLVLPAASPILVLLAGYDPQDYTVGQCILANQETLGAAQIFFSRLANSECWTAWAQSGLARTAFFVVLTLVASILVGLWWNSRRWPIAAIIYHAIFTVLFTSVFTNLPGWGSGTVGSLAYWLAQHDVQRGNQPGFYYFFIVPFYEFLPLLFALLGVRLWSQKYQVNKILAYWLSAGLLAWFSYSFGNWAYNRPIKLAGGEINNIPGLVAAFLVLFAAILYWITTRRHQLINEYGLKRNLRGLIGTTELFGFVPMVIWWLVVSYLIYSVAGEKMPWLSSHYVLPMALLAGWYFNEKLADVNWAELFSRRSLALIGLYLVVIVAVAVAISPLLFGQLQFGEQQSSNLNVTGRFMGGLLVVAGLVYLIRQVWQGVDGSGRNRAWILAVFSLLALLTIRFNYMFSFPNADYVTEFGVYAHGGPNVKEAVMETLDDLSLRLYGDKSIKVGWSDDGTWPMQWYLKDYPNRVFLGKSPSGTLNDYPILIIGSNDWNNFEPYLRDDFESRTYTFLWWPTEEYRKIGWNAIFGLSDIAGPEGESVGTGRGLLSADVRQALWDIFFYRDYNKYGQVFGGSYSIGQWPLRHDLRVYIRKDVLSNLWDYGVSAASLEPPVDPYAEGELQIAPILTIGNVAGNGEGQLNAPRNLAIGPDGNIYVADSGNHRIQVFDANGQFLYGWGSNGANPGQFNEPWGIAVDESFVYVADTWNHRLQKFSLTGEFVQMIGQSGTAQDTGGQGGFFFGPRAITLLPDNQLAVTDTGNHRIQLFDRDGNFLRIVGSQGALLGQFLEPVGLAATTDGTLYLADTWNGRVQRFLPGVLPVGEWAVDAWDGNSVNNKPYMAADGSGRVYLTDPEAYRVLIFDDQGQYLGRFGHYSLNNDGFGLPNGIAVDGDNNIYIADAGNHRVLKFEAVFPAGNN